MRGNLKILLSVLAALVLTPVCILLGYLLSIDDSQIALDIFGSYPWFKVSVVLSSFTFLYPFFTLWVNPSDRNKYLDLDRSALFIVVFLPIAFLVTYPGLDTLQINYDPSGLTQLFFLWVLHGILENVIRKSVWQEWELRGIAGQLEKLNAPNNRVERTP